MFYLYIFVNILFALALPEKGSVLKETKKQASQKPIFTQHVVQRKQNRYFVATDNNK